jgi:hypothetical protein
LDEGDVRAGHPIRAMHETAAGGWLEAQRKEVWMRTTQDYDVGRDYVAPLEEEVSGTGWVSFAAIMLGITALWNFFDGIAAISSAHVFVGNANYVFSDLNTWGWIVLFLGIIQGIAAAGLLTGSEFARWFGVTTAGLNALGQLAFAPAYPWWSLAMFALDILIIYALVVYGGARLRQA